MILLIEVAAKNQGMNSFIMFAMIFAVMYFFMIRPQIKKQKKENVYRLSLKKGDSVITIGGIYGKIVDIKNDAFIIECHAGTKIKVQKNAISMNADASIKKD